MRLASRERTCGAALAISCRAILRCAFAGGEPSSFEHRPDVVLGEPGPLGEDEVRRLAEVQLVAHAERSKVSGVTPHSRSSILRTRSVGVLGRWSITRT